MAPKEALQAVDDLLRDLMEEPDVPFGGKVLVLGGDFRQVLPVMPHCSREDVVSHSLKAHPLWLEGHVKVFRLNENQRASVPNYHPSATGCHACLSGCFRIYSM